MKRKMRKGSLLCFFTLLCFQLVLYGSSLDGVQRSENKDAKVSNHLVVAQEEKGTHSGGNVSLTTESDGTFVTERAHRAKGSSGGGNNAHHPKPTDKAAASVLKIPFVLISTTNICVSFSLLLVLPHLIA